ncbi:MAG: hypothetical protein M3281_09095 [Chloroflexota bacterium]|nr:hypothetical protein [Chloroflexota bacterium]
MDSELQNLTMMRDAERRLKGRLKGFEPTPHSEGIDEGPCCVYGLMTRKSLEELTRRVNMLLWGVGAAIVIDTVMRIAGR